MASITEVARLAGVSTATASRVVSSSDYPVSAAARERVLEAARTLDYVPNALARGLLKSRCRSSASSSTTSPTRTSRRSSAASRTPPRPAATSSSPAARNGTPSARRSYVRLLRSMRAAAVVFAGSGLDDPAVNEEIDRHLAAMRADGAAVVHLRRTRRASRTSASTTPAGSPRWSPRWSSSGTAGSRSSPGRRPVRRAGRAGWLSPRPRRGRHRLRRAAGRRHRLRSGRWRAGVDTLIAAAAPSRRSAAPTTSSRSGALQRLAELGSTCRTRSASPASTTSRSAAMTAPASRPSVCRCARWAAAGSSHAGRVLDGGDAEREVLPTELVMRETRPPAVAPAHRPDAAAS